MILGFWCFLLFFISYWIVCWWIMGGYQNEYVEECYMWMCVAEKVERCLTILSRKQDRKWWVDEGVPEARMEGELSYRVWRNRQTRRACVKNMKCWQVGLLRVLIRSVKSSEIWWRSVSMMYVAWDVWAAREKGSKWGFRIALPRSGGFSPGEWWNAVTWCGWSKLY